MQLYTKKFYSDGIKQNRRPLTLKRLTFYFRLTPQSAHHAKGVHNFRSACRAIVGLLHRCFLPTYAKDCAANPGNDNVKNSASM